MKIDAGDLGSPEPADRKSKPGDGKAAFHVVGLVVVTVFQDRVDDVAVHATHAVGKDALADTDLRSGEAGAVHVLHGFGHVRDELGELRPEFRHRIGHCAEHRISNDADIQNGHVLSFLTVGVTGEPIQFRRRGIAAGTGAGLGQYC